MSELGEITPCFTLKFRRTSRHSPARLWSAITDPAEASKWMGCPIRIDPRVGGHWHAFARADASKLWLPGVIVRVVPERTLAYVWGYSVLEWLIEPDGAGCRYSFADHGQIYPPPGETGWSADELSSGWHGWMDSFEAHLDGVTAAPVQEQELRAQYRERIRRLRP